MLIRSSKYVQIFIYLFASNNTETVGKIASITLKTSEIAEKNYRELFVVKIIEKSNPDISLNATPSTQLTGSDFTNVY